MSFTTWAGVNNEVARFGFSKSIVRRWKRKDRAATLMTLRSQVSYLARMDESKTPTSVGLLSCNSHDISEHVQRAIASSRSDRARVYERVSNHIGMGRDAYSLLAGLLMHCHGHLNRLTLYKGALHMNSSPIQSHVLSNSPFGPAKFKCG